MSNCCLIFMPILILVQGIIYLGLSIWGLALRACSSEITDISNHPFGFVMDLTYFFDKTCGQPIVTGSGLSEPVTMDNTNYAEPTINRTEAFLITYLVISAFWIVTSLWMSVSICCSHSKNVKVVSFVFWYSSVLAGCILDVVATGYHIHDVFHTTSADNTFAYLGISTTESVMAYIRSFDEYFVAPSLVMMLISSRIVLIWLINIIGSCHCFSALKKHLKEHFVPTSGAIPATEAPIPSAGRH